MSRAPSQLGIVVQPGQLARRQRPPAASQTSQAAQDSKAANPTRALETRVFVKGLIVEAEVGVYPHEKGNRRPLVVDLDARISMDVRARTDRLSETLDYDELVDKVRAVAASGHIELIETFAEMVAESLLADSRVLVARVRVEKPGAVPGATCAGVEIERAR